MSNEPRRGASYPDNASRKTAPVPVEWGVAPLREVNALLTERHYLGRISGGRLIFGGYDPAGRLVAAQVWRTPTSRRLPSDGSWLELSRWCLTPEAGPNAGSRQHRAVTRLLRQTAPEVTTLVSYSDPSVGHTGALYRSCNWQWAPTWLRLRPPPTGNGNWGKDAKQSPKDRWVYLVRPDLRRSDVLSVRDNGAVRHWSRAADSRQIAWALASPAPDLADAAKALRSMARAA